MSFKHIHITYEQWEIAEYLHSKHFLSRPQWVQTAIKNMLHMGISLKQAKLVIHKMGKRRKSTSASSPNIEP